MDPIQEFIQRLLSGQLAPNTLPPPDGGLGVPQQMPQQAVQFTPPPGSQGEALGGVGMLYPTSFAPSQVGGPNPTADPLSAAVQNSQLYQARQQLTPQELAIFNNGPMGGQQENQAFASSQERQNTTADNIAKLQQALAIGGLKEQQAQEGDQSKIDLQKMKDEAAGQRTDKRLQSNQSIQDQNNAIQQKVLQDSHDIQVNDQVRKQVDATQQAIDKLTIDYQNQIRKAGDAAVNSFQKGTPMGEAARAKAMSDYAKAHDQEFKNSLGKLQNQHQKAVSDYTSFLEDYKQRKMKESADATAQAVDDQMIQGLAADIKSIGKAAVLAKAQQIKDPAMQKKILDILAGLPE